MGKLLQILARTIRHAANAVLKIINGKGVNYGLPIVVWPLIIVLSALQL